MTRVDIIVALEKCESELLEVIPPMCAHCRAIPRMTDAQFIRSADLAKQIVDLRAQLRRAEAVS